LFFANLVNHFLQKVLSRPFGHCRKLSPAFAILHDPPPATVLPLKTGCILARVMNEIQTNNNRGAGVSPAPVYLGRRRLPGFPRTFMVQTPTV
jgi:hypothetical protein